jgi:carbon monoxide dehydrogenase subunit G
MIRMPKWFLVLLCCALVLSLGGLALADEATGKVKNVDKEKGTVVVTVDGKDVTFMTDAGVKVDTLKVGEEVNVTYKKDGQKLTASKIDPKK